MRRTRDAYIIESTENQVTVTLGGKVLASAAYSIEEADNAVEVTVRPLFFEPGNNKYFNKVAYMAGTFPLLLEEFIHKMLAIQGCYPDKQLELYPDTSCNKTVQFTLAAEAAMNLE